MVPPRGAVNGTPLGGLFFCFFLCLKMACLHTVTLRMSQYNQKLNEGHIFGPLKVILVLVEGHLRMHNIHTNIRF